MARYGWGWYPKETVASRRAKALKAVEKLRLKNKNIQPVTIPGRTIAKTFWGKAWCSHLEKFSDFVNRLPRGRSYVCNHAVCHLEIAEGKVSALVSGGKMYKVNVEIKNYPEEKWELLKKKCAGKIGSLIELLSGNFSDNVMEVVTDKRGGLFPLPGEMEFECSCPDWATMCKHVAAVMYGVGNRLDSEPELLFLLRGVDKDELISENLDFVKAEHSGDSSKRIAEDALEDVFGIELSHETISEDIPRSGLPLPVKIKAKTRQPATESGRKKRPDSSSNQPKQQSKQKPKPKAKPKKIVEVKTEDRSLKSEVIRTFREYHQLSISEFAVLLGVSTATVKNWEERTTEFIPKKKSLHSWNQVKYLGKRTVKNRVHKLLNNL
ncbi:hypothetical protein K8I28_05085 [bacterium]|nr:hypothetical protein [bacterium]